MGNIPHVIRGFFVDTDLLIARAPFQVEGSTTPTRRQMKLLDKTELGRKKKKKELV